MVIEIELALPGVATVDFAEYLPDESATFLRRGMTGSGFPPTNNFWSEGAGDGRRFLGSRESGREPILPVFISGPDEAEVSRRLDRLVAILATPDPGNLPQLRWKMPNGDVWSAPVVRNNNPDPAWGVDTNKRTWTRFDLVLASTDAFLTRERAEQFTVQVSAAGRGLLPPLVRLQLSGSRAFGDRAITNPGTADSPPLWEIRGPGTSFRAVSPRGDVLEWTGELNAGDVLRIDTRTGQVLDGNGTNRYDGISTAPRFWHIPPGRSRLQVDLAGAVAGESRVTCLWWPRRWLIF